MSTEEFDKVIRTIIGKRQFPWFFQESITYNDHAFADINDRQFVHMFYQNNVPISPFWGVIEPIISKIDPKSLIRCKANLVLGSKEPEIYTPPWHYDLASSDGLGLPPEGEALGVPWEGVTTAILYLDTNNGYTLMKDGTKSHSIANKFVSFPNSCAHTGVPPTDAKYRVVINFNYYK